jgi:hypothetical protein
MPTPVGRRSNLLLITLLLAISILLEQFFIAPIFPFLSDLGGIRPSIVFLDIPLQLPAIDLLPVSIIFALFYQIAPSAGLTREHPSISSGARVWKALTGWWALLILMVAGGGIFFGVQDYLPRPVSNGIDSFGVRADITLPYPSENLIQLHGSMVMLVLSLLGVFLLNRRTATPAVQPHAAESLFVQPQTGEPQAAQPLSSSRVSSAGALLMPAENPHARYQPATLIPDYEKPLVAEVPVAAVVAAVEAPAPVAVAAPPAKPATYVQKPATRTTTIITPEPPPTCRLTTPPPIAVVMPRPAPGVGKMHPCYVIGGLKPVKIP